MRPSSPQKGGRWSYPQDFQTKKKMRLASLFMTLGLEFQRTNWKRFLKNFTRWKALFIILPAEQDWDWPSPKGWWKPIRDRSGWRANWKRGVRSRSHSPFRGET